MGRWTTDGGEPHSLMRGGPRRGRAAGGRVVSRRVLGYRILDVLIDLLAVTLLLGLALTGMACSYGAAEGLVAPGASRLDAPLFLAAGLMFFVAAVAPAPLFVAGRAGGADDPRRGFEVVLKGVPDGAGA